MATARCNKHAPKGIQHDFKSYALPIGYPETAAICGSWVAKNLLAYG